jgi:hypothetical protein
MTAPTNSQLIENIDWPIADIVTVVSENLPIGLRARSPNGRETLSKHFIRRGENYLPAGEATVRYFAKVTVLGDRRPYNIQTVVVKEERTLQGDQYTYRVVGNDLRLAKELDRTLRGVLTKRREERNIIDDFRVF